MRGSGTVQVRGCQVGKEFCFQLFYPTMQQLQLSAVEKSCPCLQVACCVMIAWTGGGEEGNERRASRRLSPSAKREEDDSSLSLSLFHSAPNTARQKNLTVCSVHAGIQSASSFAQSPVHISRLSHLSHSSFPGCSPHILPVQTAYSFSCEHPVVSHLSFNSYH